MSRWRLCPRYCPQIASDKSYRGDRSGPSRSALASIVSRDSAALSEFFRPASAGHAAEFLLKTRTTARSSLEGVAPRPSPCILSLRPFVFPSLFPAALLRTVFFPPPLDHLRGGRELLLSNDGAHQRQNPGARTFLLDPRIIMSPVIPLAPLLPPGIIYRDRREAREKEREKEAAPRKFIDGCSLRSVRGAPRSISGRRVLNRLSASVRARARSRSSRTGHSRAPCDAEIIVTRHRVCSSFSRLFKLENTFEERENSICLTFLVYR